MKVKEKN